MCMTDESILDAIVPSSSCTDSYCHIVKVTDMCSYFIKLLASRITTEDLSNQFAKLLVCTLWPWRSLNCMLHELLGK